MREIKARAQEDGLAVFLDSDGTLTPVVEYPGSADRGLPALTDVNASHRPSARNGSEVRHGWSEWRSRI